MGDHYHLFSYVPGAEFSPGIHLSKRNLTPSEDTPMIRPAG